MLLLDILAYFLLFKSNRQDPSGFYPFQSLNLESSPCNSTRWHSVIWKLSFLGFVSTSPPLWRLLWPPGCHQRMLLQFFPWMVTRQTYLPQLPINFLSVSSKVLWFVAHLLLYPPVPQNSTWVPLMFPRCIRNESFTPKYRLASRSFSVPRDGLLGWG